VGAILVSLRTLSDCLDISVSLVARMCREGTLPRPTRRGEYDLRDACRAYVKHLRGHRGQAREVVTSAYQDERTRLTRHKADMAEMERQRLLGELVPLGDVTHAWATVVTTLRVRLLSIPTKLAARLALARNAVEAQALVRDAIHECLEELSSIHVQALPGSTGNGRGSAHNLDDTEATDEANSE